MGYILISNISSFNKFTVFKCVYGCVYICVNMHYSDKQNPMPTSVTVPINSE